MTLREKQRVPRRALAQEARQGERMQPLTSVLAYVLKLDFLDGYRLYISGAGFIGLGVYCLSQNEVEKGVAAITTGLGIIGHAGKADKALEATKAAAQLQVANAPSPPTPTPGTGIGDEEIAKALGVVSSPTLNITPVPKPEG